MARGRSPGENSVVRIDDATMRDGDEHFRGGDPDPLERRQAVAVVDRALRIAVRRGPLASDEAAAFLKGVGLAIRDAGPDSAAVASVVNDAVLTYHPDRRVERAQLLDSLLDVRLALSRAS